MKAIENKCIQCGKAKRNEQNECVCEEPLTSNNVHSITNTGRSSPPVLQWLMWISIGYIIAEILL